MDRSSKIVFIGGIVSVCLVLLPLTIMLVVQSQSEQTEETGQDEDAQSETSGRVAGVRDDVVENSRQPLSAVDCERLRRESAFFADPAAQVITVEEALRENGLETDADTLRTIACQPHPTWLTGDLSIEVVTEKVKIVQGEANERGQIPVYVLYSYPSWEGAVWGSGLKTNEYRAWVQAVADAIGQGVAWVILEPDALAITDSYAAADRELRQQELKTAVDILAKLPNAQVYIDAGHSDWLGVGVAVDFLKDVDVGLVRGFSLNVSNFQETEELVAYGNAVAAELPGTHYIIDTARNGSGPGARGSWCNVLGRSLGSPPQRFYGGGALDAYLWVKPPGESDGPCNGGPEAGTYWLEYALDLIDRQSWR